MTQPDATTWLIFIVQAVGFAGLWIRNRLQAYRVRMLWADYKVLHKIKENGDIT